MGKAFLSRKMVRALIVLALALGLALSVGFAVNREADSGSEAPEQEAADGIFGKQMTLDDVRMLAAKGDFLLFEDLREYSGANVSSNMSSYLMVYSVEGGYRLVVHSGGSGKPVSIQLESIWESGGSGIDIRYDDLEHFLKTHPSHPAVTAEEAAAAARDYAGGDVTLIDLEWWEWADEFPHHSEDPEKQALSESLQHIPETWELFLTEDGAFVAVGRRTGTVYTRGDGEAWVAVSDK